jgi:hypothetical protein
MTLSLRAIIAWICMMKAATETIGSTARCGLPAWPATPLNCTVTLLPASRVPGRVAMLQKPAPVQAVCDR